MSQFRHEKSHVAAMPLSLFPHLPPPPIRLRLRQLIGLVLIRCNQSVYLFLHFSIAVG